MPEYSTRNAGYDQASFQAGANVGLEKRFEAAHHCRCPTNSLGCAGNTDVSIFGDKGSGHMMMKSFGPSTLGGVIALMAVALSTCAVSRSAHAQQVITTCGPSTGMQYSIAPDENKWTTDGVKNGSTTFLKDKEGEYDIVIKHWGGTMTAREDGAKVILTHGTGGRMTFVVVYPLPTVEVYQLTLDSNGRGTLLWSSLKNGSGFLGSTRVGSFVATCSK